MALEREMERLLGTAVDRGISMLLVGPAGAGKSSLATQYALAALKRNESAAIYTFDEGRSTLLQRSEGLGMRLQPFLENGQLTIEQVNAAEQFLVMQMHELLAFLNQQGVLSILVMAQHGLLGHMTSPVDLSYLTDTVVLLRYFEFRGAVRKAISVIKKRSGSHEGTIREFHLSSQGVSLGPALSDFHGVLTGVPTYARGSDQLLSKDGHGRAR